MAFHAASVSTHLRLGLPSGLIQFILTNPCPDSASDHRLSAKLVPTFEGRGWHMVRTDPYGRILGIVDRGNYYFFQVAPQLYPKGWVDPVPHPTLLRKSGDAGNQTRTIYKFEVLNDSD
jgi:hypothetical protein